MTHETNDQTAGSFLSGVASRLGGFARSVHEGVQAEVSRRAVDRAEKNAVLDAARVRFDELVAQALDSYQPQVAQSDLASAGLRSPAQVTPLLETEMYRIVEILTPLMRSAEFPLDTSDGRVRTEMTQIWNAAQSAFQQKAFGDIQLPRFFVWRGGQLAFEQPIWKNHGRQGRGYYGALTNFFYGYNRPVLAP